jgi:hypothetical protein
MNTTPSANTNTNPTTAVYEIHCMLCGNEVGEIRERRFVHHPGCERPVPVRSGQLRCCRCGGSLYMERSDNLNAGRRAPAERQLARAG